MYLPLCGEELETPIHLTPPRGVPIPQTVHKGPEGLGCIGRCVGGMWKTVISDPPTGRPYPPNGPHRTGGTRVHPPLCGGVKGHTRMFPHGGAPIPPTA